VTRIGVRTFYKTVLGQIEIPKSVTILDEKCFCSCYQLRKIEFNEDAKLSSIKSSAFAYSGLTEIAVPANVEDIGDFCFSYRCDKLTNCSFVRGMNADKKYY
jgi:hypothetical protein